MTIKVTCMDHAYEMVERFWRFDHYEVEVLNDHIEVHFWND